MQKSKIILGVVLATLAALLSFPVLSRHWSDEKLVVATVAILAHGMFGVIDIFRPIIVRRIIESKGFATLPNVILPSSVFGVIIATIVATSGIIFIGEPYRLLILSVSISLILFCFYSPFWACMESVLKTGDAYLIRSCSVAVLYGAVAAGAILDRVGVVYFGLVGANAMAALAFWLGGRGVVSPGPLTVDRAYIADSLYLAAQNLSKLINDFGDRLIASFYLPTSLAGPYNLSSDMAGRVNVPSQVLSTYYYPVICHKKEAAGKYLAIGVFISLSIFGGSGLFYAFGYPLYEAYFGPGYRDVYPVFCALLLAFGGYSLSFFGQTVLRSMSRDKDVAFSFILSSVTGLIIAALSFSMGGVTGISIVIIAFAFKSSCVFLMMALFRSFPVQVSIALLSIFGSYALFAFQVYEKL